MDQVKIGKFISELRRERGMTQRELSERLGVTDRAISKWENGRGLPDFACVKPLCDALGISFNEFVAGERIEEDAYQKSLEANLETVFEQSGKVKRENDRLKSVLTTVLTVLLIIGIAFAIDALRMSQNKPVIFSSWGSGYVPPSSAEGVMIDLAIRSYCVDVADREAAQRGQSNAKAFVESNLFKIEEKKDTYVAYAWILMHTYRAEDGEIVLDRAYSIPHRFTLSAAENGYQVIGCEIPEDGDHYAPSLRKLFPFPVRQRVLAFDRNYSVRAMALRMEAQRDDYFRAVGLS